jgi:hypothetical protein
MNRKSLISAGGLLGGMTIWLVVSPRNMLMNFQMTCD